MSATNGSAKSWTAAQKKSTSVHNVNKKKRRKKFSTTSVDSGELGPDRRRFVAPMDKQIMFQEITAEFGEWTPWQKRMLLCRATEKTSTTLLTTLSTVLEPIFHRDFEVINIK